jgi:hypothetical protein
MSGIEGPVTGTRRVRHDVRDGLALMVFSAGASAGFALAMTLLVGLGK